MKLIFYSTLALFIFSIIMLINYLIMAKKQTPYYKPIQISGAKMRAERDKQKFMRSEWYLLIALAVAVILLSN